MSKTDKRRRKNREKMQAAIDGLPQLAAVPRRELDGKTTRRSRRGPKPEDGADRLNLAKRAELMGQPMKPEKRKDDTPHRENILANKATLSAMRSQSHGEAATRALSLIGTPDTQRERIAAYTALTGAYERYCRTCLGTGPNPKGANIETKPDFETRADDRPDLRSPEERQVAAAASWDGWRKKLDKLEIGHSSAIWSAYYGWSTLHEGRTLTAAGRIFCEAVGLVTERA